MQNKTFSLRASKRQHLLFLLLIAVIISALFPSVLLANADKIFKENNKAVVVVVTYNAKGEAISQGSGFIVSPYGAVITNYHDNVSLKAVLASSKEMPCVFIFFLFLLGPIQIKAYCITFNLL